MRKQFYSNGKLLITGEYAVLDGAPSLALPTKFGQSLEVSKTNSSNLVWESLDEKKRRWFNCKIRLDTFETLTASDSELSSTLLHILSQAKKLNPIFLIEKTGWEVKTSLSFPKNWGLGTSSTLINNIAQWANIDPYILLKNTFGGSGYDIACAQHNLPIIYQLKDSLPTAKEIEFNPIYSEQLYFVYLNKKQNSRDAIKMYNEQLIHKDQLINTIEKLTQQLINSTTITDFEKVITAHEKTLSKTLDTPTVKEKLFSDYPRAIKSLGAWGGDFVLVVASSSEIEYFKTKGYNTVLPYSQMIL